MTNLFFFKCSEVLFAYIFFNAVKIIDQLERRLTISDQLKSIIFAKLLHWCFGGGLDAPQQQGSDGTRSTIRLVQTLGPLVIKATGG